MVARQRDQTNLPLIIGALVLVRGVQWLGHIRALVGTYDAQQQLVPLAPLPLIQSFCQSQILHIFLRYSSRSSLNGETRTAESLSFTSGKANLQVGGALDLSPAPTS